MSFEDACRRLDQVAARAAAEHGTECTRKVGQEMCDAVRDLILGFLRRVPVAESQVAVGIG